jgi:hypothetical protein
MATRICFRDVLREHGREASQFAELACPRARDHLDGARFVMEPVRDHQLGTALLLRSDDLRCLVHAGGHRLFEQDMDTGFQGGNGILQMQEVGRGDIDRVDMRPRPTTLGSPA